MSSWSINTFRMHPLRVQTPEAAAGTGAAPEAGSSRATAPQQAKIQNPVGDDVGGVSSIEGMEDTSSGSPPLGRAQELARALEGAAGEKLRARIRRLVGSQPIAEDVIQQACESFLRYAGEIRKPTALLGRIARNQALDYLKWKWRRREIALTDVEPEPVAYGVSVERMQSWEQFDRRFTATLESVPMNERQIFYRHYLQGMTVAQIAAEDGITAKMVKRRISRMLDRFRVAMIGGDIRRADFE